MRTCHVPVGAEAGSAKVSAWPPRPWSATSVRAKFDAVRAFDDEGQRHVERGGALRVAQQSGQVSRLAGAIDAALGIDERIQPVRRRTAADAAIGEIEGRPLEAQEGVIALAVADRQHGGSRPALTARQPGLEKRVSARVAATGGKHLVAARDQAHIDGVLCFRRRQRIDEDVDAVIAGERGERRDRKR